MTTKGFQSKLRITATVITLPPQGTEPPPSALLLDVQIDCPVCGEYGFRVAGHHLRGLRDALVQMIDQHPGLCGEEGGLTLTDRLAFGGTAGGDPSAN